MSLIKQAIIAVEHHQTLSDLCIQWQKLPRLAIDTEFMRTDTYYPIPALIQVNDGQANYLIDPTVITDLSSFGAVLANPAVEKTLHACSEDIEVFHRLFGYTPENIFDTQIAAAFVGLGFSVGYANLVRAVLDVDLPKDVTRSDWLQRPLSDAQKEYAALDVEYLWVLRDVLDKKLIETDRLTWALEECQALSASALQTQDPNFALARFKSAWKLDAEKQNTLKQLSIWREQQAQAQNKPRNHIIKEKALHEVADLAPDNVNALKSISELSDKAIKRYGEDIVDIVKHSAHTPIETVVKRPPTSAQKKVIAQWRDAVIDMAEELDLAPELLARRKDYEAMLYAVEEGEPLEHVIPRTFRQDWRISLLSPRLTNTV